VAAATGIPYLVIYDTVTIPLPTGSASYCLPIGKINEKAHTLANIILGYIVPLILMTCMYSRISMVLWSTSGGGKIGEKIPNTKSKPHYNSNNHVTKNIADDKNHVYGLESTDEEIKALDPEGLRKENGNHETAEERRWKFKVHSSKTSCDVKLISPERHPEDYEDDWPSRRKRQSVVELGNLVDRSIHSGNSSGGKCMVSINCSQQGHLPPTRRQDHALVARRKVIRLLVSVIISFALCVLPYHMRMLWMVFFQPNISLWQSLVPAITFLFYYMNSGLNPILYAFLSENFRRSLYEVITCSQMTNRRGAMMSHTSRTMHYNYTVNSSCN
jgi:hypothetical protein